MKNTNRVEVRIDQPMYSPTLCNDQLDPSLNCLVSVYAYYDISLTVFVGIRVRQSTSVPLQNIWHEQRLKVGIYLYTDTLKCNNDSLIQI